MLGFIACILLVHAFQYRLFEGDLIYSGGITEIFSFIFLLIISMMHFSREVSQSEIQEKMDKFEEELSRRSTLKLKE